jgi:hypothetical protein
MERRFSGGERMMTDKTEIVVVTTHYEAERTAHVPHQSAPEMRFLIAARNAHGLRDRMVRDRAKHHGGITTLWGGIHRLLMGFLSLRGTALAVLLDHLRAAGVPDRLGALELSLYPREVPRAIQPPTRDRAERQSLFGISHAITDEVTTARKGWPTGGSKVRPRSHAPTLVRSHEAWREAQPRCCAFLRIVRRRTDPQEGRDPA